MFNVTLSKWTRSDLIVLLTVTVLGTLLRLVFALAQGVNLDEGNYIADANNIIAGLVPFHDFVSREPIYIYSTALFVKIFGPTLLGARVQSVTVGTVITILIASLTSKIDRPGTGILGASLYSFSPFVLSWGSILKLEPMGSMFSIGAILLVSRGLQNRKFVTFVAAGALLALGTLARRSELVIALGIFAFLITNYKGRKIPPYLISGLAFAYIVTFGVIMAPFIMITSLQWMWSVLGLGEAIQLHNQGLDSKLRVAYSMVAMEGSLIALNLGAIGIALRRLKFIIGSHVILPALMIGGIGLFLGIAASSFGFGFGILWYPNFWDLGLIAAFLLVFCILYSASIEGFLPLVKNGGFVIVCSSLGVLVAFYIVYTAVVGFFVDFLSDLVPLFCILASLCMVRIALPTITGRSIHIIYRALLIGSLIGLFAFPGFVISPLNPYNQPYTNGLQPYNLLERLYSPSLVSSVATYLQRADASREPIFTADTIFPAVAGLPIASNIDYPNWYFQVGPTIDPIHFKPLAFDPYNLMPDIATIVNSSGDVQIVVLGYRTRVLLEAQPLLERFVNIYFSSVRSFGNTGAVDEVDVLQRRAENQGAPFSDTFTSSACANCFTSVFGNWNLTSRSLVASSGALNQSIAILAAPVGFYGLLDLQVSTTGEAGFVLNYDNPQSYLFIRLITSPDFVGLQVVTRDNGNDRLIAQRAIEVHPITYDLKILYFPGSMSIFINGTRSLDTLTNIRNNSPIGLMANFGATFYSMSYTSAESSVLFDESTY